MVEKNPEQTQLHVTHEKSEDPNRQEGVDYKPIVGVSISKEEIDKQKGTYDEDGFYILEDGSFYDTYGYWFDSNGYDEFGGYYDEDGYYNPGFDYAEEYYHYYVED
jgi:hypothetical protein